MTPITPPGIRPPFGRYSHGIHLRGASELLVMSGQLGVAADDSVPEDVEAQAAIALANIDALLAEAGLGRGDVLRLNAYVTDRADMAGYMRARDAWLDGVAVRPASTLMIVTGFTRPEFLVEIEALAAR